MSREKQIEEMAKELCDATQKTNQGCNSICYPRGMCAHCKVMAEHLYNAGYRKASEVAREIFEEIESKFILNKAIHCGQKFYHTRLEDDIAKLKKKYTVTDINDGCKESEKENGN